MIHGMMKQHCIRSGLGKEKRFADGLHGALQAPYLRLVQFFTDSLPFFIIQCKRTAKHKADMLKGILIDIVFVSLLHQVALLSFNAII